MGGALKNHVSRYPGTQENRTTGNQDPVFLCSPFPEKTKAGKQDIRILCSCFLVAQKTGTQENGETGKQDIRTLFPCVLVFQKTGKQEHRKTGKQEHRKTGQLKFRIPCSCFPENRNTGKQDPDFLFSCFLVFLWLVLRSCGWCSGVVAAAPGMWLVL